MSNLTDFFPSGGGGLTPKFQEFNSSGTFTPSQALIDAGGYIEVFLVAGGGGGRSSTSGWGSQGGEVFIKKMYLSSTNGITVTIGSGGSVSNNGGNSAFGGAISGGVDLTANGGTAAVGDQTSPRAITLSPSWGGSSDNSSNSYGAGQGVFGYGMGGSGYYPQGSSNSGTRANSGHGGYSTSSSPKSGASGYCLIKWYE